MWSAPVRWGGRDGDVICGIARGQVAGVAFPLPPGIVRMSGAAQPAQVEFVVAADGLVN